MDIAPLDENDRPDLSRQVGIELDPITGGPVVDQYFHTSVRGIFAAGNVVQVFDLVDHVTACGIKAGESAVRFAERKIAHWADASCPVRRCSEVRCVVPHRLTPEGDGPVEFYLRGENVLRNVTLTLHNSSNESLYSRRLRAVQPPEMIHITLERIPYTGGTEYIFELERGG